MTTTRTFVLVRDHDVTGISGTGPVADGVVFPDGTTVMRWRDQQGPNADRGVRPTTVVHESPDSVTALHGHNGATRIVWGTQTAVCKHCGRAIGALVETAGYVHLDGGQRGLHRCNPNDTGLPYGYDADPVDAPCTLGCLGAKGDA